MDLDRDEEYALHLDEQDPLAGLRERFHVPADRRGRPVAYMCGNSLGLMPKDAARVVNEELDEWSRRAVGGHLEAARPWYRYHELVRESLARLVGARPGEVVAMNTLTVNLHLMMATFYRPTPRRHAVLVEGGPFPSDRYAVVSQIRWHDFDPASSLLVAGGAPPGSAVDPGSFEEILAERGDEIALVLVGGVQYLTGQVFPMQRIAAAAAAHGCAIGLDLAHAAGNVPLALHDWNVDFAVWCSYKYLNGGPGAVAGCFVHERHAANVDLPRLAGWWGNDPATRFEMNAGFLPLPTADGWQLSNPPVLSLAPLIPSLAIFDEATTGARRAKSRRLTAYLRSWLHALPPGAAGILTPDDPDETGCQLSALVPVPAAELARALAAEGIVCDAREPDVLRAAPVPLYNTFHDVWRLGRALERMLA